MLVWFQQTYFGIKWYLNSIILVYTNLWHKMRMYTKIFGQSPGKISIEAVIIYLSSYMLYRYYWLHNFIINFQSRSKFSTLYVFFIVRICKVGPSPGVAAAVPVWGSWGPLHTLFQGCVLGCPIRASSWSSGGRLRQLVSFLSVNLELK